MLIKKYYSLILVFCAGTLFAKNNVPHASVQQKIEEIQLEIESITTVNAFGDKSVIAASAFPEIEGRNYISLAPLLFKAKIGGTSFAMTNNISSGDIPISGFTKDVSLGWEWGLRASIGRKLKHDDWNIGAEFTYFRSASSSEISVNEQNGVIPLRGSFSETAHNAFSSVTEKLFDLNAFLNRVFFISRALTLSTNVGVKSTWNSLKQSVNYSKGDFLGSNSARVWDESKMWGIGPLVSLDTTWYVGCGFQIFGRLALSTLYSCFKNQQTDFVTPGIESTFNISQMNHLFVPNIDSQLGLSWSRYLNDQNQYLEIKLGYENLYYWQMNQMIDLYEFKDSLRIGNMAREVAFYGLFCSVKLFF